jgi:hypothetical protein
MSPSWQQGQQDTHKMSSKVELTKNGRPVNWHGQCWTYYKRMMEFAFADKDVLDYATGKETLASGADDAAKKKFADAQMKVEHLIMASLSMELGQQVMNKANGAVMWKYLEDTYEGKTNSATRTNQEIILFNRLQSTKCKPSWDVQQHVNNMFLLKAQLAALNADVRDPIFTSLLIRSLPANARFDRLRGMVEMGSSEVDTPEKVRGFKKQFAAAPAGHGTVELVVERNGRKETMNLLDAYHVPNCQNLLSHSQAEDQGFAVEYHGRSGQTKFELWREDVLIMEVGRDQHGLYTFDAKNDFLLAKKPKLPPKSSPAKTLSGNISAADGAADLQTWHERLGHLCPRFLTTMVDKGLVKGMMLRQRLQVDCEACHMGKERKPPAKKRIDREISRKNEVIFADLLFPERDEPVMVIVDGYTRFTTVYPLKTKNAPEVNVEMIRYIEWADRQQPTCKVKKVITDGGGEFENDEMKLWYQSKGIEFLPNPPRSSHLNPCERAHQTLVHMMKTMLIAAGFPPSLKMHALKMAAYVRKRCYHESTKDTPFRMMFGKKPDMHRIKKFGSIAYAHKSTGPSRRKMDENCRIGFLAGYREGQAGIDVYFPREQVVQRVEHAHINEGIVFKDRYSDEYKPAAEEWINSLEDETLEPTDESDVDDSDVEEQYSVVNTIENPDELPPARAADPLDPDLMDYDELDEMSDVVMDDDIDTEGLDATSGYPAFSRKNDQLAAEPKEGQSLVEDEDLEEKAPPDPELLAEVEGRQEVIANEGRTKLIKLSRTKACRRKNLRRSRPQTQSRRVLSRRRMRPRATTANPPQTRGR